MMTDRIKNLVHHVLSGDLFLPAPRTDRNAEYESYPEPVLIAMNIRDYFRQIPIRSIEGDLLTDGFRLDGMPVPGCAYKHTSHTSWSAFFHEHSDYMPNQSAFVDWNHYCNNYRFILHHGFKGYLIRIEESRQRFINNSEKLDFLDGLEIACNAVGELAGRYGQSVPFEPAQSFAESVESIWFAFQLMPDSLGRLDDVLYPFYRRDMDSRRLTHELAEEYIAELLIKVFANIGQHAHRSGDNTMVVGGYTHSGEDGFTELSEMILRVRAELPIWRPQISFRYTAKTRFETINLVTELNAQCSDIVFTNDEVFMKAFKKIGIPYEDATDYTKIGCNEWAIMGMSNTGSDGFFNTAAALEELLHFQMTTAADFSCFEDLYNAFRCCLGQKVTFMCDLADAFYDANSGDTNVLSSLMIEGCIEKACSITSGGAKYNESCWSAVGIINLADSLSAIKQFVYDEKLVTLPELIEALQANWRGYEKLRVEIISHGQFFGNNIEFADSLVNRLITELDSLANRRKPKKGGRYLFGCYIGYNSAHISMGSRTRATPDGRYSGDPFTAGIIAESGRDMNGLTAYLSSAAKLDYTTLCAPLAVNLRLDRKLCRYPDKLARLYETYLRLGGLQLQPDYLSADDLRDAQLNPEKWRSLRARVTGFTGFFTLFEKSLQNEIISRTEHDL